MLLPWLFKLSYNYPGYADKWDTQLTLQPFKAGSFLKNKPIVWLGDNNKIEAQFWASNGSNGLQELSHLMDNCLKYSLKSYSQFIHKHNKGERKPRREDSKSSDQEHSIVQTENT